jgi:hypothetical protein
MHDAHSTNQELPSQLKYNEQRAWRVLKIGSMAYCVIPSDQRWWIQHLATRLKIFVILIACIVPLHFDYVLCSYHEYINSLDHVFMVLYKLCNLKHMFIHYITCLMFFIAWSTKLILRDNSCIVNTRDCKRNQIYCYLVNWCRRHKKLINVTKNLTFNQTFYNTSFHLRC